jgi:desulfoferrodoxin (superoxide reductase-like protein)
MKIVIIAIVFLALPLMAHSPKSVELEYDSDAQILNVIITHSVNNAAQHYIYKVVVDLNGKKIIEQTFKRQDDNEIQKVMYRVIDAQEGDKISVTASCNISGKKKVDLIVAPMVKDQ